MNSLSVIELLRSPLLWLCTLISISSCNAEYSQEKGTSVSALSQEVCNCFSNHKGDIDSRLTTCINKLPNSQTTELPEKYSSQDSVAAVNSMLAKSTDNVSNIMQELIVSCNAFGSEFEELYDKWYPADSTASNLNTIKRLDSKFLTSSVADTATKTILHELIKRNIQARRLDEALQRCQQMKKLYKNEGGAYYASAFVYNLQKKYPLAINELQQQIKVDGNNDLKLFIALMKRKSQQDKNL
jgi:tetratricopeptide (TPR) repeat protein